MSSINDRIKELRQILGLSQVKFAKRICISTGYIGGLETGGHNVNDRLIKLICTEFCVNELWLRTGKGAIFRELSEDEEFLRIMTEIQRSDDPFIRRALKIYWTLSDEGKAAVQRVVDQLAGKDEP